MQIFPINSKEFDIYQVYLLSNHFLLISSFVSSSFGILMVFTHRLFQKLGILLSKVAIERILNCLCNKEFGLLKEAMKLNLMKLLIQWKMLF